MWRRRWRGVPRAVRFCVAALAAVLAYGGVVHVVQVATGGWPPYPWAPPWLAAYFTSLTVLDPLAAALLLARRRAGLHLAVFVLVTDSAANFYADVVLGRATTASRVGLTVITSLAVASIVMVRYAGPWMRGSD